MPVPFKCSSCGYEAKVKDELAGKRIKCPKCQTAGVVAGGGAAPAPRKEKKPKADESAEGLLAVNLESYQDVEVPEGEILDESQKPKKPKTKKKKKGATLDPRVKVAAIGFSLLSILVIAGLGYLGGPVILEEYQAFMEKPDDAGGAKPAGEGAAPGQPAP
ncbi:hypothetical protein SH661x_004240 [Planctomicrobium sp. SH661]|uniref:hypothetical protein n=1 Tax=Planctomicrobium sp. SH661 TaxID=3448124 RepID=UPI003F5C048B